MPNKEIKGCSFHHAALLVSDFEKSLKFYTEGLGFTLYRKWKSNSGKTLALIDIGSGEYFEIFSDGAKRTSDNTESGSFLHLALKVDSTRDAFERALKFGAEPLTQPKDVDIPSEPLLPVSLSFVKGPDGEQIEFFQPHES